MIKTGRAFTVLSVYLCIAILSACSGNTDIIPTPVDVIFDSQSQKTLGGIRLAPTESQWDGYGEAVGINGDVLAIGASEWNQLGPGSVYVYRLVSGSWEEEAQLIASDRELFIEQASQYGGQRFGSSLAVGDNVIVVGAPGSERSVDASYHGAVYVFEHHEKAWTETARLTPARLDSTNEETRLEWLDFNRMKPRMFGSHVALSGDTLAVGGDADGTVYIYQSNGEAWAEETQVTIPARSERDLYLTSMSLVGETLAVTALYLSDQLDPASLLKGNVGVYLFERVGTSWKETLRFIPDDGKVDYLFPSAINVGASVVLGEASGHAELLAVGLPGWPDWSGDPDENQVDLSADQISDFARFGASSRRSGAVYIFGRADEGDWQQQATLKPTGWDNPPRHGSFGFPSRIYEASSDEEKAAVFDTFIFPGHIFSAIPEITFFGSTVDFDGSRLAVTSGFANSTYLFEQEDGDWIYRLRIKPKNVKVELWEDYTQPIVISGPILLVGTPSEFGNSAYVFDLCDASFSDCR